MRKGIVYLIAGMALLCRLVFLCGCGSAKPSETVAQDPVAASSALPEEQEKPADAVAETPTEEAVPEPEGDPVYIEDANQYGNTMGNRLNNGLLLADGKDGLYFYDMYQEAVSYMPLDGKWQAEAKYGAIVGLNLSGGSLYGGKMINSSQTRIVQIDLGSGTENALVQDKSGERLQLVNGELYYLNSKNHFFYRIDAQGQEKVLIEEPVFYPAVYKDMIIYQCDSDGESLYRMSLESGEKTKLNNVRSYELIVYRDYVYYCALENKVRTLRKLRIDGKEEEIIATANAARLNIHDGKLYYIDIDTPQVIYWTDLEADDGQIHEIQLDEQILKAVKEYYGDNICQDLKVNSYQYINICGKYMLFVCQEEIDGQGYVDEYFYDMENDEIHVIYSLYDGVQDAGNTQGQTAPQEDVQVVKEEQPPAPARAYPPGEYRPGSVYGPKLSQGELDQVADAVQAFLNSYDIGSMSEYDRVLTAHDYLCAICEYAPDWSKNRANTAWGALIYHEAQCSGYARAMKALCDAMGVGCYYVHADENASNPSHQWNEVCVDGGWYIVDVQCNDSSGDKFFFLCSDDTYAYSTGMSWDRSKVPACPGDY